MIEWKFFEEEKLVEKKKKRDELVEKSVLVKEDLETKTRIMRDPNGRIFIAHIDDSKPKSSVYGVAVTSEGHATDEDIEKGKEMVLEEMFRIIRDVAKRKPDEFFIIHTPTKNPISTIVMPDGTKEPYEYSSGSSIGVKFALVDVLGDEEAIGEI